MTAKKPKASARYAGPSKTPTKAKWGNGKSTGGGAQAGDAAPLAKAMRAAGYAPPDPLLFDGKIHRFGANGDPSDDAGWYVARSAPLSASFGDWRSGETHDWSGINGNLSHAEIVALHTAQQEAKEQRDKEQEQLQATARKEAEAIWARAAPATGKHPYLKRKGVMPHGLRVVASGYYKSWLAMPLRDADGVLWSLQFIDTKGEKRFLRGGRKKGCFCVIGDEPTDKFCIAEGFATAATIYEDTGYTAVVALDAGNLRPVAEALRRKHKDATLVLCADDDYLNDLNTGIDKAGFAAWAVSGLLAIPDFSDVKERKGASDFNDLHAALGALTVKGCIENAEPIVAASTLTWEYPEPITADESATAKITPRCLVRNYLYEGVAVLAAPGGTGKTTMLLHEAIHIALGRPLWGNLDVTTAGPTLLLSAEDSREILVGRLRELCMGLGLTEKETEIVRRDVGISDLCGSGLRLTRIVDDVVVPHPVVDVIIKQILASGERPVLVMIDPVSSYGTGEARINDSEQGLVEVARRFVAALQCCARYVQHTGKQNAREKILDQYAGRGGSAMPDGSRMTAVMHPVDAKEWKQRTAQELLDHQNAIVLARPKVSYAPPNQPLLWIRRTGWKFVSVTEVKQNEDEKLQADNDVVLSAIQSEIGAGNFPTQNSLMAMKPEDLSERSVRGAVARLKAARLVEDVDTGKTHGSKTYLRPTAKAAARATAAAHRTEKF